MKYVIAQEANNYGAWQCTTAVQSLVDLKVDVRDIYILLGDYGYNRDWNNFETRFYGINIHRYRNHSVKHYKPAVKPYLLWHFFKEFPFLEKEQWCLLDNDVILLKKFTKKKTGKVYVSDCSGYLDLTYLEKKGVGLAEGMAKSVDIPFSTILNNDNNTGGAQYIFDSISGDTWRKAYNNSIKIYDYLLNNRNTFPREEGENEVQYWCSEMWAVLWSIWDDGHKTKIVKDMDFLFATDPVDVVNKQKVIHNAGVNNESDRLFNKGNFYKRSPKGFDMDIDETKVSYLYFSYLKKVL